MKPWQLLVAIGTFLLDRISKFLILRFLLPGESVPVAKGVLYFTLVENKGIAFGLFGSAGNAVFLIALISFLVFLPFFGRFLARRSKATALSFGIISSARMFLLAGAAGNIFDRLRYGHVVDFIDLKWWPVFNVADSAITIGVVLLLYCSLKT